MPDDLKRMPSSPLSVPRLPFAHALEPRAGAFCCLRPVIFSLSAFLPPEAKVEEDPSAVRTNEVRCWIVEKPSCMKVKVTHWFKATAAPPGKTVLVP